MKRLHEKGSYSPADLKTESTYQDFINKNYEILNFAIVDNDMPEAMTKALQEDAFLFGSLKANAQLFEASKLLLKEDGSLKSFSEVSKDFDKLNVTYNNNYLEAEYIFATSSSQMAAKWSELGSSDRYNLQYRTAKDERVRATHQVLHDITLPKEDPFWLSYYPPNGWRCRCTAVEVLKSKYETSDSDVAIKAGEKATTEIGKDGKNRLEIFRFNPGAEKKLMPPKHPYNKVKGAKETKEIVKKDLAPNNDKLLNLSNFIKGDVPTNKEVKNILMKYAELFPEDFRNGLDDVKFIKSRSYMMQHSIAYSPRTGEWVGGSKISLSSHEFTSVAFNPLEELKNGFGAMKKGEKLSFKQEYAFESLWHEILHAKTKTPPRSLSHLGTKSMETINQFCARHTYPEFIERLGGKSENQKDILDKGFGYSGWINDFRARLKTNNIPEEKALKYFMPLLMNDYGNLTGKISEFFEKNTKQTE